MANTFTYTSTRTRTEAVIDQFDIFLRYTGLPAHARDRLLKGVEEMWFEAVAVYLVNGSGKRILEAEVAVNWSLHSDLAVLSPTVRGDLPGWESGAAPEIQVIGSRFGRKAEELNSAINYWVLFTSEIRANETRYNILCDKVGVSSRSRVPEWATLPQERAYCIDGLREVSTTLRDGLG
jgi:hypothetical protein